MSLNERLRRNGHLSAWNILFSRDDKKEENIVLNDKQIAGDQKKVRDDANFKKSSYLNQSQPAPKIGEQVMLRDNPKKHNIRDTFVVTDNLPDRVRIQKIVPGKVQLRNKTYFVPKHRLFKIQAEHNVQNHRSKRPKYTDFDPIKRDDSSDSDDDSSAIDQEDSLANANIDVSTDKSETSEINEPIEDIVINMDIAENANHDQIDQPLVLPPEGSNDPSPVVHNENIENMDISVDDNAQGNMNEPSVPPPEGSTDPSPAVLNDSLMNIDMSVDEGVEVSKRKKDIWYKPKPRRKRETWFTPQKGKQMNTRRAVIELRRKIAALRIQKWYRKIKIQQNYERELITPELVRDTNNEDSCVAKPTPEARILSNDQDENLSNEKVLQVDDVFTDEIDQESSCDWDPHETCIELSDPLNEAGLACSLNLHFSYSEPDLNKVYDFTNVLPITSSPKALDHKRTTKRKYNTLKKSIAKFIGKKRGGTPSNRQ